MKVSLPCSLINFSSSPSAMALSALKKQLDEVKTSMFEEGLLDEQYCQIEMLQDASDPGFVADLITTFFHGTERFLNRVDKILSEETIDFQLLDCTAHQLKGSSACLGAQSMKFAADPLIQFCQERNMEGFRHALHAFKEEYLYMKSKLMIIQELEQKIRICGATPKP